MSLYEVLNYWIDHPWGDNNIAVIVNLDTWNRVPKHLQDLMIETFAEMEIEVGPWFEATEAEHLEILVNEGMEPIYFSAADAKAYTDIAYKATWEAIKTKVSPDVYDKLKEFLAP